MDGGSCEATYDEEEEEEDDDAGSADGDAHATDETTGDHYAHDETACLTSSLTIANAEKLEPILQKLQKLGKRPVVIDDATITQELQVMDVSIRYCLQTKCTMVSIIGRTMAGHSVGAFLQGWYAHMVVKAPAGWTNTAANGRALAQLLDEKIATRIHDTDKQEMFKKMRLTEFVHSVELVSGESVLGYYANNVRDFLRIRVVASAAIQPLRDVFHGYMHENGTRVQGVHIVVSQQNMRPQLCGGRTPTFESAVETKVQFMSDMNAKGYQWLHITGVQSSSSRTTCDYELDADVKEVQWKDIYEHSAVAPIRLLSFDIEAAGRRGIFPDAACDPCIMVGIHFKVLGASADDGADVPSVLLCLGTCDAIANSFVLSFDHEADMLRSFAEIVSRFDADCIYAFNQNNFDLPYMMTRAVQLGADSHFATVMSRIRFQKFKVVQAFFESAQTGKRMRNKIEIPGRCSIDVFVYVQANFKLESYKLNDVANHFLGEGKEDMYFGEITTKWKADSAQRREVGVYCLKDAELPLLLDSKLSIMINVVEACRTYGLSVDLVMFRGATIRCDRKFFGACIQNNTTNGSFFFVPFKEPSQNADKGKYQGATVLPVKKGAHEETGVLDFSSMYPNEIVAANVCPTTMVVLPNGKITFVPPSVRKGLLPMILIELMAERKRARVAAENEPDPMLKDILNARQLQLKIACNSVYGWLGSEYAAILLRELAEIVTALGRQDIESVQQIARTTFTPENGYPGTGVNIVCGDTDSVFVCFTGVIPSEITGMDRIKRAFELCEVLATAVNAVMQSPKKIEVEKVYIVIYIIRKKGYGGLVLTSFGGKPKVDIKGLECVRRNGCALIRDNVRYVLEILVHQRDVNLATAAIRGIVDQVLADEIPLEQYVMRQVLRKTKPDCSKPLPPKQLAAIRAKLIPNAAHASVSAEQLSYTEIDAAIRAGVPLHFETNSLMPHVEVAWRMRLRDPGTAPVPGDVVEYIVTSNGRGHRISEKAETLKDVRDKFIPVDRRHYLAKLREVFDKIIQPLFYQQAEKQLEAQPSAPTAKELQVTVKQNLNKRVWERISEPLQTSRELKRHRVQESAIATMFRNAAAKKQ